MDSLRVGLIGCGRHGERYLRHLANGDVDGLRAVALWRRDAAAAAALEARYGVPAVGSLEALLDPGLVDGVLVLTPPGTHLALLEQAVAAGLGVLVEKPVVASWEEARALAKV